MCKVSKNNVSRAGLEFQEGWRDLSTNYYVVAFDKSIIYQSCMCFLLCPDILSNSWISAFDCGLSDFLTFIKTVCMWAQTHAWSTNPHKYNKWQRKGAAADWFSKTPKLKHEPREEERSQWVHISPTSENHNGIRQRIDWSFCACLSVTWNIISSENGGNTFFPWWFGPVKL